MDERARGHNPTLVAATQDLAALSIMSAVSGLGAAQSERDTVDADRFRRLCDLHDSDVTLWHVCGTDGQPIAAGGLVKALDAMTQCFSDVQLGDKGNQVGQLKTNPENDHLTVTASFRVGVAVMARVEDAAEKAGVTRSDVLCELLARVTPGQLDNAIRAVQLSQLDVGTRYRYAKYFVNEAN